MAVAVAPVGAAVGAAGITVPSVAGPAKSRAVVKGARGCVPWGRYPPPWAPACCDCRDSWKAKYSWCGLFGIVDSPGATRMNGKRKGSTPGTPVHWFCIGADTGCGGIGEFAFTGMPIIPGTCPVSTGVPNDALGRGPAAANCGSIASHGGMPIIPC